MKALLALLILFAAGSAAAQDAAQVVPDPGGVVVQESAKPAAGAVTGQRVAIYVDVLFRDGMPHPPRVEIADIKGAQIFQFETQGSTIRETIGAGSYVGQRFEFAFYARRAGDFMVPPAEVTLLDHEGAAAGEAKGTPLKIVIETPPGVSASEPIVATQRLALEQSWSPDPNGPHRLGDAITRTITRTAEDVPALAFGDVPLDAPEGVRAYGEPPESQDSVNRGALTGRRVDRITYVIEQAGSYRLPAFRQPWWDLSQQQARSTQAAGVSFEVEAAPAGPAASADRRRWLWAAAALVALLGLYGLAHLLRRRPDQETIAFRALAKACKLGDAPATYRAFVAWRDQLAPEMRARTEEAAMPLRQTLFGGGPGWTGEDRRRLLERVNAMRQDRRIRPQKPSLPPLNPTVCWGDDAERCVGAAGQRADLGN